MKAGRKIDGLVAMRHPDAERGGDVCEERQFFVDDRDFGMSILALAGGTDLASEVVRDELEAVADAKRGEAEIEDLGIGGRRVGIIDRARSPGGGDADGLLRANLLDGGGAGQDDGEDVLLADAAGDQLCVLRAEIENDDRGCVHGIFYLSAREFWIDETGAWTASPQS